MENPKLNPDDLVVSSFETESLSQFSSKELLTTTDPTPATRCYWCPPPPPTTTE